MLRVFVLLKRATCVYPEAHLVNIEKINHREELKTSGVRLIHSGPPLSEGETLRWQRTYLATVVSVKLDMKVPHNMATGKELVLL